MLFLADAVSVNDIVTSLFTSYSKVICLDIVYGVYNSKEVYYFIGKCPYTTYPAGWVVATVRTHTIAERLERRIRRNLGYDPKIWISDGETSFHTGLENIYGTRLRTIYLGSKPSKNTINRYYDRRTYFIYKDEDNLVVKRGYFAQNFFAAHKDEPGYGVLVSVILDLFNNQKAEYVCISTKYKISPLKNFCKRFVYESRNDKHVYHFIGSCKTNGWVERLAKDVKKRNHWFDNNIRSLYCAKKFFDLRMKTKIIQIVAKTQKMDTASLWQKIVAVSCKKTKK